MEGKDMKSNVCVCVCGQHSDRVKERDMSKEGKWINSKMEWLYRKE
jgi:hypothetical protein